MATTQELAHELITACRQQDRGRVVAVFDTVNRERANEAVASGLTVALYHLLRGGDGTPSTWQQHLAERHQRWATISDDVVERLLEFGGRTGGADVGQATIERAMLIDTIAFHQDGDAGWETRVTQIIQHAFPPTS